VTRDIALPGTSWRAQAVLVEPDGVLVDTDAAVGAAWRWWARTVDADPEDLVTLARGRPIRDVVADVLGGDAAEARTAHEDIAAAVDAVEQRLLVLLRSASPRRGAAALLRAVPPRKLAIVSSARRTHLDALLRRGRFRAPELVLTADDDRAGRPSPEAHLAAAATLGVEPSACTTIERTAAGVAAGVAAGMRTVVVVPHARDDAPPGADIVVHIPGAVQVRPGANGLELRISREPKRYA
jgi:mannitol-1-/sugar-/sorbitol-6-phosphatase